MTANTPPTDRSFWRAHKATRERLRDCGYEYLVIDNRPRSKTGNTYGKSVPSSEKFATESNIHQISGAFTEISLTPKTAQDPQAIHSAPQELDSDRVTCSKAYIPCHCKGSSRSEKYLVSKSILEGKRPAMRRFQNKILILERKKNHEKKINDNTCHSYSSPYGNNLRRNNSNGSKRGRNTGKRK